MGCNVETMPISAKYRKQPPGANYEADRRWRNKIRAQVFAHYGDECAECGAINDLQIDHVDQNGASHRKTLGGGGSTLYRWLVKHGFPEGYRTLCGFCNELAYTLHRRGHDVSLSGFTETPGTEGLCRSQSTGTSA